METQQEALFSLTVSVVMSFHVWSILFIAQFTPQIRFYKLSRLRHLLSLNVSLQEEGEEETDREEEEEEKGEDDEEEKKNKKKQKKMKTEQQ